MMRLRNSIRVFKQLRELSKLHPAWRKVLYHYTWCMILATLTSSMILITDLVIASTTLLTAVNIMSQPLLGASSLMSYWKGHVVS